MKNLHFQAQSEYEVDKWAELERGRWLNLADTNTGESVDLSPSLAVLNARMIDIMSRQGQSSTESNFDLTRMNIRVQSVFDAGVLIDQRSDARLAQLSRTDFDHKTNRKRWNSRCENDLLYFSFCGWVESFGVNSSRMPFIFMARRAMEKARSERERKLLRIHLGIAVVRVFLFAKRSQLISSCVPHNANKQLSNCFMAQFMLSTCV